MVSFYDERNLILFLYFKLRKFEVDIPPESSEANLANYEKRVRNLLLSGNKGSEREVDIFINNTRVEAKKEIPCEDELEWFTTDSRASYWLLCKTDQDHIAPGYAPYTNTFPVQAGNSLLNEPFTLGFDIPPVHNLRVRLIKDKVVKSISEGNARQYILKLHNEWNELITKKNLFSDVNGKAGVTIDWLLNYLQENNVTLQKYRHAEGTEEKIAYCYASYFIWREGIFRTEAERELFIRKFKSALSTQKSREKKRADKNKALNVIISQETHDKLRDISVREGISNARVIEYAIHLAWKQKLNPR
ncbi:TPA: hypothetical protein ACTYIV_000664 [Citrobacter koseri]|uniref:hypothetical protein n=1 Tax=Citrobacter koseri TaxID=545 RepID=UPI000D97D777|nr:hypothetical protein [Citrobacter koseri]SQB43052.1 Uncharacterised protein [Citrobacter koseri]HCT9312123.1 hypothetical protein [Citrobacter koseri]